MTNVQANPAIMLCFSAMGMYRLVSFTAAKIRKKHHGGNISKEKLEECWDSCNFGGEKRLLR